MTRSADFGFHASWRCLLTPRSALPRCLNIYRSSRRLEATGGEWIVVTQLTSRSTAMAHQSASTGWWDPTPLPGPPVDGRGEIAQQLSRTIRTTPFPLAA